jgi:hypothetical protein
MYTINRNYGIGQIIEENETMITVYFEESDIEKKLLKEFTTTYATIQEAELALNPELTEADMIEINAIEEAKAQVLREGAIAARRLEEIEIERSINLKKHI